MTSDRVVIEEMLTKPSEVCPTLFVGLGGAGCSIVARVANHLKRRPDYEERYSELIQFAFIDTNINDLERYREVADESFLISNFEKEEYANLAAGKLFLEADEFFTQWVPQDYRFRAGDTAGAGQIRIESRLGLYYQMRHGQLVPKFRRMLEGMKSHEHGHRRLDSTEIRIILCYSVAGGTGSGSHLPLAYTLRDLASELGKPTMLGVCVLPAVFEDKVGANKDGTFANGYAALKENEYLMRLGAPESRFYPEDGVQFHYDGSDASKKRVHQQPFNFVYLIDRPESYSISNPLDAAADGLFLQFFSPLYAEQAGDYDNYTQHQRFLVPHDFEGKGIVGYTQYYGSYGSAVLMVPVDGLIEYCSRAASLRILKQNVLGQIPADKTYNSLRASPDAFFEVRETDDQDSVPIEESKFHDKDEHTRAALQDRLFRKRVRLLANCEHEEGRHGRFWTVFKHGHPAGSIPTANGVDKAAKQLERDQKALKSKPMKMSVGAVLLESLVGDPSDRRGEPGLVAAAMKVVHQLKQKEFNRLGSRFEKSGFFSGDDDQHRRIQADASTFTDEGKKAAREKLANGFIEDDVQYPGFAKLNELKFLKDDAGGVDLAALRYAFLNVIEAIESSDFSVPEDPPAAAADSDVEKIKSRDDYEVVLGNELDSNLREVDYFVRQEFFQLRKSVVEKLHDLLDHIRSLEKDVNRFEADEWKRIEQLRTAGDSGANQFAIDSEALQIENGRRMWDFFFYDRVVGLPALSLSADGVKSRLTEAFRQVSLRGGKGRFELKTVAQSLTEYAALQLRPEIAGDRRASDEGERLGLKLADALKFEVEYRALYRTSQQEVESEPTKAIPQIVASYRSRPDRKIDFSQDVYQEYFRDKIRRIEREKTGLICSYDESRDQHGGVRPNHVFLGVIAEDFGDEDIASAIKSVETAGIKWISEGWQDQHKVVFYRAVLNVPLYVFGRMNEMKDYYYRFKNLAKRSKVLHIDKNWENTLPDLDPDGAQEKHRQETVREHIINFGVLLTMKDMFGNDTRYILRQGGKYYLQPPQANQALGESNFAELGSTITSAIEHLPEVLDAEKVKYVTFQKMFKTVHDGLAPGVLQQVVGLPFKWRKNRDQLRTQYGTAPSPEQQIKLKDYTESYERMTEALLALLERLRNIETEQLTIGGGLSTNSALSDQEAARNLRQSIQLLRGFEEGWRSMENPAESTSVPRGFEGIFAPLPEDDLRDTLEVLRSGEFDRDSLGLSRPAGGGTASSRRGSTTTSRGPGPSGDDTSGE